MMSTLPRTTAPPRVRIEPATTDDTDTLTALLASVFHDDAVAAWIFPDPGRRAQILPAFFDVLFRMSVRAGGAFTTAGRDAVILTTPPGHLADTDTGHRLRAAAGEHADALEHVTRLQDTHKPETPHHHIAFIAGRPGRLYAGFGAALLRHVLDRADRQDVGAYAEASSGAGRALGIRNGFRLLPPALPVGDGVILQPMWRPAHAG
jgi:hypothetical protein